MKKNCSTKIIVVISLVALFIFSIIAPLAPAYNARVLDKETIADDHNCYHFSEVSDHKQYSVCNDYSAQNSIDSKKVINIKGPTRLLNGPMDSAWPMYCHDVRHTGRSLYTTADNSGIEKWRFSVEFSADGSPVIDNDGTIYISSFKLYAIYPNGTLKWKYNEWLQAISAPAISEDGILYVGSVYSMPDYLYAIYTNNGTLKWKYLVGEEIFSSPAIGSDGSIYFGSENDYIYALYPNGTLKWRYLTSVAVYSSPAIGDDGTVYCGSHDCNLYALYPNNGSLKWAFHTGNWIRTSPCIADDGTIYCVSLDNYLYAIYPNGTMKWRTNVGAGTSPTIGQDGTIYCGYSNLYAIYPTNGSVKWIFDPGAGRTLQGATPCNSIDGTIYFGASDGAEIIAVNPDGTEKWREYIGGDVESPPAIGEDGTVYIGDGRDSGYLHAFGTLDPNAPTAPEIDGPASGKAGTSYDYTFTSTSPLGNDVYYYIDWGNNAIDNWTGPYESGETITASHTYANEGTYTISARAKDTANLWGPWGTMSVTMPLDLNFIQSISQQINQQHSSPLLLKMMQRLLLNIE